MPEANMIRRFVPKHIKDPGVALRMIRSRDPAAWFTLATTGAGLLLAPLDRLLEPFERRRYARAQPPHKPLVFVCGAPRTGTTLVSQVLIKNLPVSYFNNLTAIFPRSPIVANRLFGRFIGRHVNYRSYYSKTVHLSGPNDAFYIWNRWMAEDESGMRCVLMEEQADDMVRFFGAYERAFGRPVLSKNNSLNTRAQAIANVFPNAHFICMNRDEAYLAQSLLKARQVIQGDVNSSLWVDNPDKSAVQAGNYVEDVCDQVLFHQRKIAEQQRLIGPERFWIVRYEDFCADPAGLVERVSCEVLGEPLDAAALRQELKPFAVSNKVSVSPELFAEINQAFERLKAAQPALSGA
jgi:hypothetical protein